MLTKLLILIFLPKPVLATFVLFTGDKRVNVWPSLTAIHELFVREHNRIADILYPILKNKYPQLTSEDGDEMTYQEVRRITAALLQVSSL